MLGSGTLLPRGLPTPTDSCLQGAGRAGGEREESGHGRPSSLLQPAPHPPRSSAAPEPSRPPQLHPLPSRGWGGPCQRCMPRTQPSGAALCPPRLTGRAGRVTEIEACVARAVSTVTCPLEHAGLRVVGLTGGPRWPGKRAGPGLARNRSASLLVTFLPLIHKEMDLGEGRQAEAGGRSLSESFLSLIPCHARTNLDFTCCAPAFA